MRARRRRRLNGGARRQVAVPHCHFDVSSICSTHQCCASRMAGVAKVPQACFRLQCSFPRPSQACIERMGFRSGCAACGACTACPPALLGKPCRRLLMLCTGRQLHCTCLLGTGLSTSGASSRHCMRCCERMRQDAGLLRHRCREVPAAVQLADCSWGTGPVAGSVLSCKCSSSCLQTSR